METAGDLGRSLVNAAREYFEVIGALLYQKPRLYQLLFAYSAQDCLRQLSLDLNDKRSDRFHNGEVSAKEPSLSRQRNELHG